jgi:putative oxidoreductase
MRIQKTDSDKTTLIIRLVVSSIFITEGIQKFIYSDSLGAGRFMKIGIPYPELSAPFVGASEIMIGSLILIGLFTRIASAIGIIIMLVALSTTKLSLILNHGVFHFFHEARNDLLMLFCSVFLLLKGSGARGLDHKMNGKQ